MFQLLPYLLIILALHHVQVTARLPYLSSVCIVAPVPQNSNKLKQNYSNHKTNGNLLATKLVSKSNPKKLESNSLLKTLGPILASAFTVAAIMYPLDLIRALQMSNAGSGIKLSTMQLLSNFRQAHGIKGFFTQGLLPELARSTWMRFVKFSLFPLIHTAFTGVEENKGTGSSKALAAIVASIPEALSIMPLEIAKIALQLDNVNRYNNNMFRAMAILFEERGPSVFILGYVGVQMRQALWSVGYFTTIKMFQRQIEVAVKSVTSPDFKLKDHPTAAVCATVFAGFLGGVFGGILNTPFDTIRSTLQKNFLAGGTEATAQSFLTVCSNVIKSRGFTGLYSGFSFKALHLGGGGALMAFFIPFFTDVFNYVPVK